MGRGLPRALGFLLPTELPDVRPRLGSEPELLGVLRSPNRPADDAGALWSRIDREIVDQAPIVPLVNPKQVSFLSERVGNYQYSPQSGVLLDQLWVR